MECGLPFRLQWLPGLLFSRKQVPGFFLRASPARSSFRGAQSYESGPSQKLASDKNLKLVKIADMIVTAEEAMQ
jgi:hypothetical protein